MSQISNAFNVSRVSHFYDRKLSKSKNKGKRPKKAKKNEANKSRLFDFNPSFLVSLKSMRLQKKFSNSLKKLEFLCRHRSPNQENLFYKNLFKKSKWVKSTSPEWKARPKAAYPKEEELVNSFRTMRTRIM